MNAFISLYEYSYAMADTNGCISGNSIVDAEKFFANA